MTRFVTVLGLGAAMAFCNPVFAQSGGNNDGGTTSTTRTDDQRDDNDTDYGWIGLLGLAGLAGLLKKPERQVVHQTDLPRNNPPH